MLNSRLTATRVRSPELSRWMRWVRLPRGAAWMSISLSSGSSGLASRSSHSPPPNRVWNTRVKLRLDGGEGLEEHGAGGPVDLPDGLDQRLAGADQVVPLGGEELEPLHFLRVLLDRERVDRADGLERADDSGRLGLQRLQVEVEHRRLLDQLVERPAPLGLDPLHDAPPGAGGSR